MLLPALNGVPNMQLLNFAQAILLHRRALLESERKYLAIGLAAKFTGNRDRDMTLADFMSQTRSHIAAEQFEFFFDRSLRPTSYATWILPTPARLDAIIANGIGSLATLDSCGGDLLWIDEFIVVPGMIKPAIAALYKKLSRFPEAYYERRRGGRRIVKAVSAADLARIGCHVEDAGEIAIAPIKPDYFDSSIVVGKWLELYQACEKHLDTPLREVLDWIDKFSSVEQFTFTEDGSGAVTGLVTWAWLSPRTIAQLPFLPLERVHASELNEGASLCFVEAVSDFPNRRSIQEAVLETSFPDIDEIFLYCGPSDSVRSHVLAVHRHCVDDRIQHWFASSQIRA